LIWFLLGLLVSQDGDYRRAVEAWRAEQEAFLRSESGWLTLAGLEWLEEGENRIRMPAGAPDFGVFERQGTKVALRPAGGGPRREMETDTAGDPTVLSRDGYSVTIIQRGERIGVRIRNKNAAARTDFPGMRWFPVKEEYRIVARWEPHDPPKLLPIANVLGDVTREKSPGRAVFRLGGKECSLEPVESGRLLFFIFRDGTAGKETYGGGRFLYAERPEKGRVVLDFNKAVNPPCAFTPFATCPLPPRQNRLPVAIAAGELSPGPH